MAGKLLVNKETLFKATVSEDHQFTILPKVNKAASLSIVGYYVVSNVSAEVVLQTNTFTRAQIWVDEHVTPD